MTEQQQKREDKGSTPRHGKSMGECMKCRGTFKLKRNTKHSKTRLVKGICPQCGSKKESVNDEEQN